MNLIDILTAILLITASVLCIALIFYIGKITNTIKAMQETLTHLSAKTDSLFSNISELSEKVTGFTDELSDQLEISRNILGSVKDRVGTILELEEKVRLGIEVPLLSIVNNFKAISNGVSTFFNYFKK